MGTRRAGLLAAVVLGVALAGCSSAEAGRQEPAPSPEATQERAEPAPAPTDETAEPRMGEAAFLALVHSIADDSDVALEPSTDSELTAAGQSACEVYEAGGSRDLARAMTVLDLPEGLPLEAHELVALAAASALCPEHWERVHAEATGG